MKKFAFVSDFDGTLTERDFYHILIDRYIGKEGREFYREWKKTEKINVPFLNRIFAWSGLSEEALREEIYRLPFDPYGKKLIDEVEEQGGDFYIVSAGTSYYIDIFLKHLGLDHVKVISMPASYIDGRLVIQPDPQNPYFSTEFGLDKQKVMETLRREHGYDFMYFSGDSEPDYRAALYADVSFTKGELTELIRERNEQSDRRVSVNGCADILAYLGEERGVR